MCEEKSVAGRFRLARFVAVGVVLLVAHAIAGETTVNARSMIGRCAWPLRVKVIRDIVPGVDKAYLEDQKGEPFLYNADTCWHLMFQVSDSDVLHYLDDCRRRGNTVVQTMLIPWTRSGEDNWFGEKAFMEDDFSRPNEMYWQHVDFVVRAAAERNITLMAAVAWKGTATEGWNVILGRQSEAALTAYGEFLGRRYANALHMMVFLGGDSSGRVSEYTRIARGIKSRAPHMLIASHPGSFTRNHSPMSSTSPGEYPQASFLDISWVYTYRPGHNNRTYVHVYSGFHVEWDRNQTDAVSAIRPAILGESTYIGHGGGGDWRVRRNMHWPILAGGAGHAHGNDPIWRMGSGWKANLNEPSRRCLEHVYTIYKDRAWHMLVPESNVKGALPFIHSGREFYDGTRTKDEAKGQKFVVAARTPDGTLGMAFLPTTHPGAIGIDLSRFAGPVTAIWADPTSGRETVISGSPLPNDGPRTFARPGNNSYGFADWLLILEVRDMD